MFSGVVVHYFRYILYEIVLAILGAKAIVEDVIAKKRNICPLVNGEGRVAVVTGGARGIGSAVVKNLLMCKMTVIIGCRDKEAALKKKHEYRQQGITSGKVVIYPLELASFDSIRRFAGLVLSNHDVVHLLVNNAGIMFPPYRETDDGFESQWGVNFLGPALLTHLLFPLLEKGSLQDDVISTRIVNVSSCAHAAAEPIIFDNINMKNCYIASVSYAQSKLAQILLTIELDRQLRLVNSKVFVHSVHPGIVNTDLFDGTLLKETMPWLLRYICKSVDEGASSVLFPCISPALNEKGGTYSANCCQVLPSKLAQSNELQNKLFEYTTHTLKISGFGNCLPP